MSEFTTMGSYLSSARRRRGVSIERAAEDTRIRSDFLMRMESDEFDFLAPAYVRGFLKTYARFLRVEEAPLLEEFDRRYGPTRADASQIVALDRKSKSVPKDRPRLASWTVAAAIAAAFLLVLALIGLFTGNEDEAEDRRAGVPLASSTPKASPSPTGTSTPSPTPTPTKAVLALNKGLDLKIVASTGRCWVQVIPDGGTVPAFTGLLEIGDRQRVTADKTMTIILGYAAGVELTLNGHPLGSPGVEGPLKLEFPKDAKQYL